MIREEDFKRELDRIEKEVQRMERPTKTEFMRLVKTMEINLKQPEEFEMPEFLKR